MNSAVFKQLCSAARHGNLLKVQEIIRVNEVQPYEMHGPYNDSTQQEEILCKACSSGNLELIKYLFEFCGKFFLAAPVIEDEVFEDDHCFTFGPLSNAMKFSDTAEFMLTKTLDWMKQQKAIQVDFRYSLFMLLNQLTTEIRLGYERTEFILLLDKYKCLSIALDDDNDMDSRDDHEFTRYWAYKNVLNAGRYDLFELFMRIRKVPQVTRFLRFDLNDEAKAYLKKRKRDNVRKYKARMVEKKI